jgi:transcriptional regulator with XRE-family HTH domain
VSVFYWYGVLDMAIAKIKKESMEGFDGPYGVALEGKKKVKFSSHLKFLRKSTGLTLEGLSELTGISVSYLSRLESGSRRLNTDLISRLSNAFGCDPSELLHDYTDSDIGKVMGQPRVPASGYIPGGPRHMRRVFTPFHRNTFESRVDIPTYELCHSESDHLIMRIIEGESQYRPAELATRRDAIAVKTNGHFEPHFCHKAVVYAVPSANIVPEALVIASLKNDAVLLRKVWGVSPSTVHLCAVDKIEHFKKNGLSKSPSVIHDTDSLNHIEQEPIVEVNRNLVKEIFLVVGYFDISLL